MNIKQKIEKVPVLDKDNFPYTTKEVRGRCAEVAQAEMDALIAEIDEAIFDEYSGGYFHRLDIGGAEITDVLDKYRSTK